MRCLPSACVALGTLALVVAPPAPGEGQEPEFTWDSLVVAASGPELGIPLGSAVDETGSLYVANMAGNMVLKFAPTGELVWESGGEGDGPGEYRLIYRVTTTPRGTVLALDFSRHDVTELSSDGEFLNRVRLPFRFTQIDGFVALPDGTICVVGVTRWSTEPFAQSIHTFDQDLRYVGSFGPVPPTEEAWVLERWGAGGVSLSEGGDILFTQRLPHRIYRFKPGGELLATTEEVAASLYGPDDAYERTRDGITTTYRSTGNPVLRPHPAHDAGRGWLVVGRSEGADRHIDVVNPSGQVHRTYPMPSEWRSIAGVDPERGWLWVKGERALEPIYFRVSYRLDPIR